MYWNLQPSIAVVPLGVPGRARKQANVCGIYHLTNTAADGDLILLCQKCGLNYLAHVSATSAVAHCRQGSRVEVHQLHIHRPCCGCCGTEPAFVAAVGLIDVRGGERNEAISATPMMPGLFRSLREYLVLSVGMDLLEWLCHAGKAGPTTKSICALVCL